MSWLWLLLDCGEAWMSRIALLMVEVKLLQLVEMILSRLSVVIAERDF